MKPVQIREDVDPESPEYRRNLIIVIGILFLLTLVGGSCLGYRIRTAENARGGATSQTKDQKPADEPALPAQPLGPEQSP